MPPQGAPEPPQEAPSQSTRVAREALNANAENSKHLRQETLYTSVTTLSRKKRGTRG